MRNMLAVLKVGALTCAVSLCSMSVSAYEIKHGYSVDEGMAYYGECKNGKDLVVIESKDGSLEYEGPASKGKLKKGANLDKAARKACGEDVKV